MELKVIFTTLLIFITVFAYPGSSSFSDNLNVKSESDPEEWKFTSQRDEIAPVHSKSSMFMWKGKSLTSTRARSQV